jgi:hypothetical protein
MKHIVIWHGRVSDVRYRVEADSEDDPMEELSLALSEGDE